MWASFIPLVTISDRSDWTMASESPPTRLICPLTGSSAESMRRDMLAAAKAGADTVELRLDFLQTPPSPEQLEQLLSDAPVDVIATCRPKRQGGLFEGEESQRLEILRNAAEAGATFIDIEDDVPTSTWPGGHIILSHHDFQGAPSDLEGILARLDSTEAAVSKVAFAAAGSDDALRALDLLRSAKKPTLALAMGEHGILSRILSRKFDAFGTFAALRAGAGSAPGQPTIGDLRELYRWDAVGGGTQVYGVIGCPVAHSMSPGIHNAAFSETGIDAVYIPLRVEPGFGNFSRFLDALVQRSWVDFRGLSVTIPHKENALKYVGPENCDELARRIGSINTITISPEGDLRGDNTDYAAAIDTLCNTMDIDRGELSERSLAVIGAGGGARAIVAALRHYGAAVTIYNRTVARGEKLAEEFSAGSAGLDELSEMQAEIVINCTSVGMHPHIDATPLRDIPPSVKVVFDTVYNPVETRLLAEARAAGRLCISGLDMFVNQGVAQFEIWTGRSAPRRTMRKVVLNLLSRKE